MGRWTGSWLGGPSSADLAPSTDHRGQRLSLPESGRGALAPISRRLLAFAVDAVASALVAALFTAPDAPGNWSLLAFVVDYLFFGTVVGQTAGMRPLRLRMVRVSDGRRPLPWQVVVRTALLVLLIPALITDRDGRGLHDKAARTVVVRT